MSRRVVTPQQKEKISEGRRTAAEARAQRPSRQRLLNASEAGEYLGLAEWTIRQWASMGRIPKVKLGKALRFDVEDLDRMIVKSKIPAGALSRNLLNPKFPS